MDTFKCKYVDEQADKTKHFYFEVADNENSTLRAKEMLRDRGIDYSNIILKLEMSGYNDENS